MKLGGDVEGLIAPVLYITACWTVANPPAVDVEDEAVVRTDMDGSCGESGCQCNDLAEGINADAG